MELRIRVPRIPAGLIANLVGLAGLVAVAAAVGGLTGVWWWSLLIGGVFAVGLAYVASAAEQPARTVETAEGRPRLAAAARSA